MVAVVEKGDDGPKLRRRWAFDKGDIFFETPAPGWLMRGGRVPLAFRKEDNATGLTVESVNGMEEDIPWLCIAFLMNAFARVSRLSGVVGVGCVNIPAGLLRTSRWLSS